MGESHVHLSMRLSYHVRVLCAGQQQDRQGSSIRMALRPPPTLQEPESQLLQLQQGLCRGCAHPLPPTNQASSPWSALNISSLGSSMLGRRAAAPGPRRCHFDGWLYCHECHGGDTHIVPAQVLARWDFREYPVSENALAYLQVLLIPLP